MQFGYWANSEQPFEQIVQSATVAEQSGWDGFWFADHFFSSFGDGSQPWLECWATLAGVGARVPRLRLGSLVAGNTYRHPALLTKTATTVDAVSGGRVVLGLGAGWQENEHVAYGIHFGTVRERLDRLEEAAAVVRALLHDDRTTFAGAHYDLSNAPMEPKGSADRRIPLLIGGGGEQRTLRVVARFADEWNIWGTPETLVAKGAVLDQRCEEVGRDPGEIRRSAVALLFMSEDQDFLARFRDLQLPRPALVGTPAEIVEHVAAYEAAGVHELIIPDFNLTDPALRHEVLEQVQRDVAAAAR
jgi:F420-dependent oxidoreductase-like protein